MKSQALLKVHREGIFFGYNMRVRKCYLSRRSPPKNSQVKASFTATNIPHKIAAVVWRRPEYVAGMLGTDSVMCLGILSPILMDRMTAKAEKGIFSGIICASEALSFTKNPAPIFTG